MFKPKLIKTDKGDFYSVAAPVDLCLLSEPEIFIRFFNEIEAVFKDGKNVIYDFSACKRIELEAISVVISQLKDRNINKGRLIRVEFPDDEGCNAVLKSWGVFKKVDNVFDSDDFGHIPTVKMSDSKVMNELSRDFVKTVTEVLYGEEVRVRELYEILIECMANTNNHASIKEGEKYKWWLCSQHVLGSGFVSVVFLDLGLGIFESIPVKQYIRRVPLPLHSLQHTQHSYVRGKELSHIYTGLINGKIKSSTGLPNRGRGLPLIDLNARSGHFKDFFVIANDAYINVANEEVSVMNEHFSGTLLSFKVQRKEGAE